MWTAQNFMLLSDFKEECWGAVEAFIASGEAAERYGKELSESDEFWSEFSDWIFLRYLDGKQGSIFVTQPSGNVLRLSSIATGTYFDLDTEFLSTPKAQKFFRYHSMDPFPATAPQVRATIAKRADEGEPARENVQATNWAGLVVAEVLGLDLAKTSDKARIKTMLRKWIDTGVLSVEKDRTEKDKDVPHIFLGPNDLRGEE